MSSAPYDVDEGSHIPEVAARHHSALRHIFEEGPQASNLAKLYFFNPADLRTGDDSEWFRRGQSSAQALLESAIDEVATFWPDDVPVASQGDERLGGDRADPRADLAVSSRVLEELVSMLRAFPKPRCRFDAAGRQSRARG